MSARRSLTRILVVLTLPLLGACANLPGDRVQGEVAQTVSARVSRPVDWNAGVPEDRAVRQAVRAMLADELSLDEAIAIALVNNREMRARLARAQVARADLIRAGLLDNPVFGLSLLRDDAGTESELSLFEDFLNVVTLSARKKLAATDLERTRLEVAQSALDLIAEVKRAWYALVADRQAIELFVQVTDATEAAAELARRQYQAGNLSLREQALQQSFHAQSSLEAARAEAAFNADREKLNRLLGLWGEDTAWRLPDRLPDVPDRLPPAPQLENKAVDQRLDLAAQRAEVEAVHLALHYTKQTRWLSAFGIGFTVKRDPDGGTARGPELELGLPLFDRGQARIARLEAQLREAESRYAQLAIDVRAEVREAMGRLAAAHDSVRHYREAILPLAERVVEETLKFYNGMLVGVYELLAAKQAQINAARDYIGVWREFWTAWADLERAAGAALAIPAAAGDATSTQSPAARPEDQGQHQHGDSQ
ncbi:MAG TPA: TolC family protein [Burkholderiales bacterium]|nr:TolC family protein [Burkholderiales bacterium]